MDDEHAAGDEHVAGDHEHGEPYRKARVPIRKAEHEDAGQEEELVRDGIEDPSQSGALIVVPSDVTVDGVAQRCGCEEQKRNDPIRDVLFPSRDAFAVVRSKNNETRNQKHSSDGDLIGEGHFSSQSDALSPTDYSTLQNPRR